MSFILNPYIHSRKQPNTFIGGVGATITTKSALATKLGISESIIKTFSVVGTEVQAYINTNYNLTVNRFNEDTDITWYKDLDGKVQSLDLCFRNATNLVEVYFPACVSVEGANSSNANSGCFSGCVNLETAHFENWQNTGNIVGNFTFYNCIKLTGLDTSKLTGRPGNRFLSGVPQTEFDLSSLTQIDGNMFLDSNVQIINAPVLTSMFQTGITNCPVKEIYLPSLEAIAGSNKTNLFSNLTQCELIEAKKLKAMIDPTIRGTNAFNNLKTGCLIKVHEDLATANSGNADEALVWVKANRSATVEFYDDNGDYVSTL